MQAYVDDIIMKSVRGSELLADLIETFTNLRRYNMKLNSKKCIFRVPSGKLLGFIISK